jgi:hypothetical protein
MEMLPCKTFFLATIRQYLANHELRSLLSLNDEWKSYRTQWIHYNLTRTSSQRFVQDKEYGEFLRNLVKEPQRQLSVNLLINRKFNSLPSWKFPLHSLKINPTADFHFSCIVDLSTVHDLNFLDVVHCRITNTHKAANVRSIFLRNCETENDVSLSVINCPEWHFQNCFSLQIIRANENVRSLGIYDSVQALKIFSPEYIQELNMKNLRNLDSQLLQAFSNLHHLTLASDTVREIPSLPKLKSLFLYDCYELTMLAKYHQLTLLWMKNCPKIQQIVAFPRLKILKLSYSEASFIKDLPELRSMELFKCHRIKTFSNCLKLSSLTVEQCNQLKIEERSFPVLKKIKFSKRGFKSWSEYIQHRKTMIVLNDSKRVEKSLETGVDPATLYWKEGEE